MAERMPAAVFRREGEIGIDQRPVPPLPGPGEVLLRVRSAGICGTDLHILEVPPGHPATPGVIMGHEYTAEILALGPGVKHLQKGDTVVISPDIECGVCAYCRRGLPNLCSDKTTLGIFIDGGFAPFNLAPAKAVHRISPKVPPEIAVLAEPLSCVLNGFQKVSFLPGQSAVILGAGPIGLLFLHLLRSAGAGILIVSEPSPIRREKALLSGADLAVNPLEEDLEACVHRVTPLGADLVIDAVGIALPEALKCVRRGGTLLLFGMNSQARATLSQNEITRYEIKILGTYSSNSTFPSAIQLLESGRLSLASLITQELPLERIFEGLDLLRRGLGIKIVVKPS